jgi:excisionase family DNA binding protein
MRLDELTISVYKNVMNGLTTKQAAEKLGVGIRWIQALITDGRLPARKIGRDYIINEKDLKLVEGMKPGPKPKAKKKGGK